VTRAQVVADLWVLVTEFRCWLNLLNVGAGNLCKMIVDVGNQNGQNRHQHISSPKSVTNIDVTGSWQEPFIKLEFMICGK